MCLVKKTMKSTLKQLRNYIDNSEAIVIGAGSGLSNSAGFEYGGETFLNNFEWMHEKYGYIDMYSVSFHHFNSSEEKWAFWLKFIYLERYKDGAKPLYRKLHEVLKIRITLLLRQMSIISFNFLALIKISFFILKAITDYFNVLFLATVKLTITRRVYIE